MKLDCFLRDLDRNVWLHVGLEPGVVLLLRLPHLSDNKTAGILTTKPGCCFSSAVRAGADSSYCAWVIGARCRTRTGMAILLLGYVIRAYTGRAHPGVAQERAAGCGSSGQ